MLKNFEEIKLKVQSLTRKNLVVVSAHDEELLKALRTIQDDKIASVILVGEKKKIEKLGKDNKISLSKLEIVDEADPLRAGLKACELINNGDGHIIMKGLLDTGIFMRSILDKEKGLYVGNLLSYIFLCEPEYYSKLLIITDSAVNIAPNLSQKVKIIENTVRVAQGLGIETPLVACLAAIEKVNFKSMPATADAAILAKMSDRGQFSVSCVVDGPLSLDSAISDESAKIKGIKSEVAGRADIILCDDIETANALCKALLFLAKWRAAAIVTGAKVPIVLTSRADNHSNKYLSVLLGLLVTTSSSSQV